MSRVLYSSCLGFRSAVIPVSLIAVLITGCTSQTDVGSEATSTSTTAESAPPEQVSPSPTSSTKEEDASQLHAEEAVESDPPDNGRSATEGPTVAPVLPVVEGAIDEEIELTTDFVISLSSLKATVVEAETPGDVAGDAVEVIVQVTNNSSESQSVNSAVVSLETMDGDLGIPTIAGGAEPLDGGIEPKESVEGRYIFMLDPVHDREVIIRVNYAAGEPIAEFTGVTP